MQEVPFRNFSGGINTRDLASELAENEFPYSSNVTIDERGEATKRLGYVNRYGYDAGSWARDFNGTTDYYEATDNATLDLGDVFAMEIILKRDVTGGQQIFFDKGTGAYRVYISNLGAIVLERPGAATICVSTATITDTTTDHHIWVTKNAGAVKIWLDGVDVTGVVTNSTMVNNATNLRIGANVTGTSFFNGRISRLALYSAVPAVDRVATHYAARTSESAFDAAVIADSPVSYWKFHPLDPLDDSVGANNLTAFGTPSAVAGGGVGSAVGSNLFYWASRDWDVAQIGKTMHINGGVAFHQWTTDARCGMAEFNNVLYMNHPVDGLYYYNGSGTPTHVASAPKGNSLATWQNKLWSNDSINVDRVWFSPIGDPTAAWPGTNWVAIREKDSTAVTCLAGASGTDISGRPGLLAFKQDSAYRIHDSSDGAYTQIDAAHGCGSNIGAISAFGRTFVVNPRGIFSTDGLAPMQEQSALVENLFHKDRINQNRPDLYAAGRWQDRLYFSLPAVGQTVNTFELELHPLQNWIVPHTKAAAAYSSRVRNVTDMIFCSPTLPGKIYTSHTGGSDDGANIVSVLRTHWKQPGNGHKVRVRRARFVGNGEFTAYFLRDYESGEGTAGRSIDLTDETAIYDEGYFYNQGALYGPSNFQSRQDEWSIGVFRAIAIEIRETSSLTRSGPEILEGTSETIGAWTLSHVNLLCIDLGID